MENPVYLTTTEAANYLGLKRGYLYKLTCTKQIPYYKYGRRRILFELAALEDWRKSRMIPIPTQAQAAAHAAAYCAANPLRQ